MGAKSRRRGPQDLAPDADAEKTAMRSYWELFPHVCEFLNLIHSWLIDSIMTRIIYYQNYTIVYFFIEKSYCFSEDIEFSVIL